VTRTLAALCLLAAACSETPAPPDGSTFETEARALDGDTVVAKFRLLDVDAFELGQLCQRANRCWQCGKAARDSAARLLGGNTAVIELTAGSTYGRSLAVVTVDGEDLGERLIRAGLAIPDPGYLHEDTERARHYRRAFAKAKADGAGALTGRWLKPSSWRQGKRLSCGPKFAAPKPRPASRGP
jgi:micrococcal nuclease